MITTCFTLVLVVHAIVVMFWFDPFLMIFSTEKSLNQIKASVMDKKGICPDHCADDNESVQAVPSNLTEAAQPVISRILYRLLHEMRRVFLESEPTKLLLDGQAVISTNQYFVAKEVSFSEGFNNMVELLTQMAESSSALQDVMTNVLVSKLASVERAEAEEIRKKLDEVNVEMDSRLVDTAEAWENRSVQHQIKFSDSESFTLLDEFAFWQGRLHHPDQINQFFLHLGCTTFS